MACFLSVDFEYTHPSPTQGAAMEVGLVACSFEEDINGPRFGAVNKPFVSTFYIDKNSDIEISRWVKENQRELLETCYNKPAGHNEAVSRDLKGFIRSLPDRWRDKVIPVGWTLGSDLAYLLDLLGKDSDLVHYSAIDLDSLMVGLLGLTNPTNEHVIDYLRLGHNPNPHDALSVAYQQLGLVKAAVTLAYARSQ